MAVLESLVVELAGDIKDYVGKLKEADEKTEGWAKSLGSKASKLVGGALLGGASAVGAAVGGLGVAAFNASENFADATKRMTTQLGLTEVGAENFDKTMRRVFAGNFGDSIDDVAQSLVDVETAFGRIGGTQGVDELQKVTEAALGIRDAFDIEVAESTDAAVTLMEKFGLTADQAFGFIVKGQQQGLNASGDFLDTIGEYATQFSNAGFDAEEFFSILQAGQQGGVLGTDKIADAIKEMGIILNEGTDEARAAFQLMGLDFDQIAASVRAGDETWAEYFPNIIAGLQGIEDPIARSQAQVALFGTMAEDLGADFTDAFNVVTQEVDIMGRKVAVTSMGVSTSLADMEASVGTLGVQYETFGDLVSGIWRRLVVSITPFTDMLLNQANAVMPTVTAAFDQFDAIVRPLFEFLGGGDITPFADALRAAFGPDIAAAITDIALAVSVLIETLTSGSLDPLQGFLENVGFSTPLVNQLAEAVLALGPAIMGIIGPIVEAVTQFVSWQDVLTVAGIAVASIVIPALVSLVTAIAPVVAATAGAVAAVAAMRQAWQRDFMGIRSITETTGGRVRQIIDSNFGYVRQWFDSNMPRIQQIVEFVLNAIRGFWESNGEAIMRVVNNTFDSALTIVDTVIKTILDIITLALQILTGDWEGAWETVKGIVERIWQTIQTIIGNQIDSIRALITNFDWGGLGSAIVDGIANGLRNAAGRIAEAARNAAQRAYDAARSWLGIHSPSKKAEQDIGEPFAEGIARGIDAGLDSVTRRIATGLTGLMDGIQPSPAAAGAASGGITNYFQITIGPGATYEDGRRAGRGVLDELRSRGLA